MTKLYRGPVRGVPEGRRWWRRRGGGQGGEGLAGHGESRRCCGAAGRRCLTTVGRDRQVAAKTEESAVQQTRRMPRPFPTLAPRPAGTRRGNKDATEGPQQQKGLRRRCVAAKRGGEDHRRSKATDTAKPQQHGHSSSKVITATAGPRRQKNERPIVYGRPLEFVSKTVGWDGTSPRPAPERRNRRGAWSERHQEPADSQRTSS